MTPTSIILPGVHSGGIVKASFWSHAKSLADAPPQHYMQMDDIPMFLLGPNALEATSSAQSEMPDDLLENSLGFGKMQLKQSPVSPIPQFERHPQDAQQSTYSVSRGGTCRGFESGDQDTQCVSVAIYQVFSSPVRQH